MIRTITLIAIALGGVSLASAEPLSTLYRVDQKVLTKGLRADGMLDLSLYSDSACTSLAHQTDVQAGSLFYTREKNLKLKGGTKPPKTASIGGIVDVPNLDGMTELYLRVSGPGIQAVGGECQVQRAAAPSSVTNTVEGFLVDGVETIMRWARLDVDADNLLTCAGLGVLEQSGDWIAFNDVCNAILGSADFDFVGSPFGGVPTCVVTPETSGGGLPSLPGLDATGLSLETLSVLGLDYVATILCMGPPPPAGP